MAAEKLQLIGWEWLKIEAVPSPLPEGKASSGDASLGVKVEVEGTNLSLIFHATALTPAGVTLELGLKGRWQGPLLGNWDQSEMEKFITDNALLDASTQIDDVVAFLGDKFKTPYPVFSQGLESATTTLREESAEVEDSSSTP